ncbi:HAD family hydrolase [Aminobacter niigataensis]|uniref:HAD family hydrolase n=1 Tax=Aminobacter niigataensis TaxID=83265 RepID=UPI0024CAB2A8|nr:HAD-IA family hydrolase [Aminobacter niigataensis]CAI2932879.1 Pyrophosphatase PpaX [Aminobacter niigataensis]
MMSKSSGRKLAPPRALLLDFGGVIVSTAHLPGWQARLAGHVRGLLDKAGLAAPELSAEQIADDIKAGGVADSHWKNAMSRPLAPRELRHEEFWGDFVAGDWPQQARDVVVAEAYDLCCKMGNWKSERVLRSGMLDLLDAADAAGVPVGIVSNALCGKVHVDFLDAHGLTARFATVVHSDEVKVRKPNPEMIWLATRALGIDAAEAWYVGDNFDRDVLCGKRAGIGGNILMEDKGTYDLPYELKLKPDAIVADPVGLLGLFREATRGIAA